MLEVSSFERVAAGSQGRAAMRHLATSEIQRIRAWLDASAPTTDFEAVRRIWDVVDGLLEGATRAVWGS